MRFFSLVSSSLILLGLSGTALAKAPSRSFLEVGTFSPHSAKPLGPATSDAAYDSAARTVLAEQAPWTTKLSLSAARTSSLSDGRKVVKYTQTHAGLPVLGRGVTVTFGEDGLAHIIAQKLDEELPSDITPAIDVVSAAKVASQAAGLDMDSSAGRLVVWPTANGNVLAWHFYQPIRWAIPYAPAVVVDAKTGELIVRFNKATTVHKANVYPTNPVKSPQLQSVDLPLPDGATTLSDPLVNSHNCIDKKTTKLLMGFIPIHVCELVQTAVADPGTLDFSTAPEGDTTPEDPFAELHIYAHTHKAYDYFRGFQSNFLVQANPIAAVANLRIPQGLLEGDIQKAGDVNLPLEPFQNAFFTPGGNQDPFTQIFGITSGGAMMFGQGPVADYSYDGDVIYHEFTHAVVDATIQLVQTPHNDAYGIVMSPGAMNEGLADFFSSALAGDPDVGEYAVKDFDATLPSIRSLAAADSCPSAIGGEVHQDATLFSAGLWDVRKNLSAALQGDFDKAVFSALVAAPSGDLNFDELAKIIIEQVKAAASLGSGVSTQLGDAWTKRGVLPQCTRLLEYTGTTMQGPLDAGPGVGGIWFGPGKQSANLGSNALGYVPGVVQYKVTMPEKTDSISIEFEGATANSGLGGGMGTFAPKVLVRFGDQPIQFTYSPFATTPDLVTLTPQGSGSQLITYTAETPVTAGTTTAYVMIANSGDADGLFTNVNISTTQAMGAGSSSSSSVGVGGAGGGSDTGGGGNSDAATDDSSCSCSTPGGSSAPASLGLVALAAAASLLARRRRS